MRYINFVLMKNVNKLINLYALIKIANVTKITNFVKKDKLKL